MEDRIEALVKEIEQLKIQRATLTSIIIIQARSIENLSQPVPTKAFSLGEAFKFNHQSHQYGPLTAGVTNG